MGNRCVDIQGLAGNAAALVGAHHAQRAHVVQAVRQLHQDDTNIAHHGQDHLTEIFSLRFGMALELDLCQLADPIHQFGDISTKLGFNLLLGGRGILDHVVQDRGHNRLVVEPQLRENACRGNGMVDVGLTGQPVLALVCFGTKQIGAIDLLHLLLVQVGIQHPAQIADQESRSVGCA